MTKKLKYPKQVGAIVREKKTFSVDSALSLPTKQEYDLNSKMPLEMHSNYSRFVLAILDFEKTNSKRETPSITTANLPAGQIPYILKQTELSLEKLASAKNVSVKGTSPAFTQKLFSKEYSGMTPGEYLLRHPDGKENLEKTKSWLSANLAKYPRNKSQIEAIDDAIALLESGKLTDHGAKVESYSTFCIYKDDIKIPNISKLDEKGYTFVYNISIQCTPGRNYPYAINIMNCTAPPIIDGSGQTKVELASAENKVENSILLSEQEWFFLINRMARTLDMFEEMHFPEQYQMAEENSYHFEKK